MFGRTFGRKVDRKLSEKQIKTFQNTSLKLPPYPEIAYAHIEIVVTLIVVNFFSFLVIALNAAGRFGSSLDT